jgi:hypothetical protein
MQTDHTAPPTSDRGYRPAPSRAWRVLEAMAYAGALFDPTGALMVHRFRRPEGTE